MNTAEVLRKWETYAYRLAFQITREEKRAVDMAAEALFAARFRLVSAASDHEAEAMVKRAVLQKAVAAICDCLCESEGDEGCEPAPETRKNGSPD